MELFGFYVKINIQSQRLWTYYLFTIISVGWWLYITLETWFYILCHAGRFHVGILNLPDSLLKCGK